MESIDLIKAQKIVMRSACVHQIDQNDLNLLSINLINQSPFLFTFPTFKNFLLNLSHYPPLVMVH